MINNKNYNLIVGKTNQFKLTKITKDFLKSILLLPIATKIYLDEGYSNIYINYFTYQLNLDKKESSSNRYQRMHKDIKDIIYKRNTELGINKKGLLYEFILTKTNDNFKEYIVIFASPNKQENNNFDFIKDSLILNKMTRISLLLMLKCDILNEINNKNIDLDFNCFNNEMYIGGFFRNIGRNGEKKEILDCFKVDFYLLDDFTFGYNLLHKIFVISSTEDIEYNKYSDLHSTIVFDKEKKFTKNKLDARKFNRAYFDFYDKYKSSKNYQQNWMHKKIESVLNKYNIEFSKIRFNPEFIFTDFYKIFENDLKISVLKTDNVSVDEYEKVINEFSDYLNLLRKDNLNYKDLLDNQLNLIISKSREIDGDNCFIYSISPTEQKIYQKTLSAYYDVGNHIYLDEYTKIKIKHIKNIIENSDVSITQGFLIDNVNDDGKKEINFKNIADKIKNEFFLKRVLFVDKKIPYENKFNLVISDAKLIYVSKNESNKVLISVLTVSSLVDYVSIDEMEILNVEDFEKKYGYINIKKISKIKNIKNEKKYIDDTFYIYMNDELLVINDSDKTLNIIGNNNETNINLDLLSYFEKNEKLHKRTDHSEILLPFYYSKKTSDDDISLKKQMETANGRKTDYGKIYIEIKDEKLITFISSNIQPNKSINKQILTEELLLLRKDEYDEYKFFLDMKNPLLLFYLTFLTIDVLSNNETSKKSILQKLTEMLVNN